MIEKFLLILTIIGSVAYISLCLFPDVEPTKFGWRIVGWCISLCVVCMLALCSYCL